MGFAYMTTVLIFLGFLYLVWLKIIKPLLESKGIEVDEEEPITTSHTKELERLKRQFGEKSASAQAAKEGLELAKDIKYLEDKIKEAEGEKDKL